MLTKYVNSMMKLRKVIRTGHVARMGEELNACRVFLGTLEVKKSFGRPAVYGRIIYKYEY